MPWPPTLPQGRWPLVDGYLALAVPEGPVHEAYYWSIVLRELRGGIHTEVVIAAGLTASEACQLDRGGAYFGLHGYGDEDRVEETEELRARRLAAEDETTAAMAALLGAIDSTQRKDLAAGALAMHEAGGRAGPRVVAAMADPPAPLVLLHGFGSTFDHNWRQTGWVDVVADSGRPVPVIDLPGHGSSPAHTDPSAYGDLTEDVYGSLPVPTDAVGFSAGAELAAADGHRPSGELQTAGPPRPG